MIRVAKAAYIAAEIFCRGFFYSGMHSQPFESLCITNEWWYSVCCLWTLKRPTKFMTLFIIDIYDTICIIMLYIVRYIPHVWYIQASMSTYLCYFILYSSICHDNLGISTSLNMDHHFFHDFKNQVNIEVVPFSGDFTKISKFYILHEFF